jgi:hypothetical protein
VERLLNLQVNRAHIAAALDHLSAKLLAPPPIDPLLQHVGDDAAPPPRRHGMLEPFERNSRQRIRPFPQLHSIL